jgi:hypothetical protein
MAILLWLASETGKARRTFARVEVNITTLNHCGILFRLFIHFYENQCIGHFNFYSENRITINPIHIETWQLIDLDCITIFDTAVIRPFQTDGPAVTPFT